MIYDDLKKLFYEDAMTVWEIIIADDFEIFMMTPIESRIASHNIISLRFALLEVVLDGWFLPTTLEEDWGQIGPITWEKEKGFSIL